MRHLFIPFPSFYNMRSSRMLRLLAVPPLVNSAVDAVLHDNIPPLVIMILVLLAIRLFGEGERARARDIGMAFLISSAVAMLVSAFGIPFPLSVVLGVVVMPVVVDGVFMASSLAMLPFPLLVITAIVGSSFCSQIFETRNPDSPVR